jgi:hypothetical protein
MLRAITLAHPAATQGEGLEFVAWHFNSLFNQLSPSRSDDETPWFLKAGRRKQGQRRRPDGERRQR